jgi:hypothetical protein
MTGLKGSSTLGTTGHVSASLVQGDTVQFTTGVLGNADHFHVAANGPVTRLRKGLLISRSSSEGGPGHQLSRPALVPADSSIATSALITVRPVDATMWGSRLLIVEPEHVPCRKPGLISRRESSGFQFQRPLA